MAILDAIQQRLTVATDRKPRLHVVTVRVRTHFVITVTRPNVRYFEVDEEAGTTQSMEDWHTAAAQARPQCCLPHETSGTVVVSRVRRRCGVDGRARET